MSIGHDHIIFLKTKVKSIKNSNLCGSNQPDNQKMKAILLITAMLCIGLYAIGQQKTIKQQTLKSNTNLKLTNVSMFYTDTLVNIRLTRAKLNELKANNVNLSAKASEYLSNYVVVSSDENQPKIISKKVLDDGGIETTYDDKSRRIKYNGGITVISPDGQEMKMLFLQTPPFEPPTDPNDPDIAKYLSNIHDAESISNFQNGDAGLNIYQRINRRIAIIDYLIAQQ